MLRSLYQRCAPASVRDLARPGETIYRNAQYLAATVSIDPYRMQPWLPRGVRLAEPARADLFCAYFPENSFGSVYREVGLFVHVQVGKKVGIHCPWMIVDDDVALILGREVCGYPKKIGQIEWRHDGDEIVANGTRQGATLVEMHASLGDVVPFPPPILGRPHRNAVGLLGLSMPRLVAFTPNEINVETRVAQLELKLGGTERDPIHAMGIGAVLEARLHRIDIVGGYMPPIPVRPLNPLYLLRGIRPRIL
ncbi:acetoacetate decarboxylase family protein [Burkholderia thailandensis]|uniref:Acetoacetate decarboxylase family protein n=1 Tax=Burkholderia thailandensis TaxID=57975 RepID=A0AAW9CNI6_BURTH|nr:acetoacetate decarboxylase family protein [Burkholderia thailandensis]AHI68451.1 acetoacetate decarboxylase family protein [Burkholderia thailandensis H0587]AVR28743.1 acetoacetate decarboxylase [Burkholderia thailandensis]MCS3392867.1 acetoacetate decarboxylase family protein [Burkholderia thailandensis]MCS6425661.1 acetoacetate decarboxylase family protein [Burkholderia thailandensis]MCS6453311.1 acetoacetate decarboxylase family protein [Burkholderia thailandensis]